MTRPRHLGKPALAALAALGIIACRGDDERPAILALDRVPRDALAAAADKAWGEAWTPPAGPPIGAPPEPATRSSSLHLVPGAPMHRGQTLSMALSSGTTHRCAKRASTCSVDRSELAFVAEAGPGGEIVRATVTGSGVPPEVSACTLGLLVGRTVLPPVVGEVSLSMKAVCLDPLAGPPVPVPRVRIRAPLASAPSAVDDARAAVEAGSGGPAARERLVRALSESGRFDEAADAARALVVEAPRSVHARLVLAGALALVARPREAVTALDEAAGLAGEDAALHLRAARALERVGEERLACFHWRSAAALWPSHADATYEALRCRARVHGDRVGAAADAREALDAGRRFEHLDREIRVADVAAHSFEGETGGTFEVDVRCEGQGACPTPVVRTPSGELVSIWTPGETRAWPQLVTLARVSPGTYRVLLVPPRSGATGTVRVITPGAAASFGLPADGAVCDVEVEPGVE